jgi:anti-sigma regulatory factor (Ser/Thr protein kinase)
VDRLAGRPLYEGARPAEPANVGMLRRELNGALQPLDLTAPRLADVMLVVSEALTNAALHAYVGMASGPVALMASVSSGSLRVTVTDEGRGMVPRPDSPGLGVGLGLMARLTDALEISSPGGRGTEVCFTFDL